MSFNCSNPGDDFSFHKEKIDVGIFVGLGLCLGFVLCTIFIYYKFIRRNADGTRPVRSVDESDVKWFPTPPDDMTARQEVWYKKKAAINLFSIVANAVQLSAFAFAPSVPWSQGHANGFQLHLHNIFNAFMIQWGDELFKATFWTLVAVVGLLVLILIPCSGFFMVMCKSWVKSYNDADTERPALAKSAVVAYKMVAALTLILDLFGLSILTLLFTPLNCTYYEDRAPTLDIDPHIKCWEGDHIIYAACSIIILIPLYAWSVIVQICDHEEGMSAVFNTCIDVGPVYMPTTPDEIRTNYAWAFYYTQLKLVIAAGNAFFSHHSYTRLIILLACDILILTLSCLVTVNQYKMHNLLRRLSIIAAIWTVICGFIAQIICDPTQWASFVVWLVGIVVLIIITIIVLKRTYSKEYYTALWRESNNYGGLNNE